MDNSYNKAGVYAGVTVLVVVGIILVILCILCKFCMTSRKAQRWSGLDALLSGHNKREHQHGSIYSKTIIGRDSSSLSLKMEPQGTYAGYNSLGQDISITKLPNFVTQENGIGYNHDSVSKSKGMHESINIDKENVVPPHEDAVDISRLKSSVLSAKHISNRPPPPATTHTRTSRLNGTCNHLIHNNYTIYEETSDLSGNEASGANGDRKLHHTDIGNYSSDDESLSSESDCDATLTHSDSSCSFESSLELLEEHDEDSSLGQVEYSLQYHRENSQLVVHLMQARDLELPTNINGNLPDTFIKTFATDCQDQDPKKQTKICKSTANPMFKENFFFRIHQDELSTASITMQVFTRDHYARQKLVGEICAGLTPLTCTDYYRTWSNIVDYDHQPPISYADVQIGLGHDRSLDELTVSFTHLKLLRVDVSSSLESTKELYTAVTLFSKDNQPKLRKKTQSYTVSTSCQSRSLEDISVIFNEIDYSTLHDSRLLIELCQIYSNKSHQTLGYTVIGYGTSNMEYGHWLLLTNNNTFTPRQPISMWHSIHLRKPTHNSHSTIR